MQSLYGFRQFRIRFALTVLLIAVCLIALNGKYTQVTALEKSNHIHKVSKSHHLTPNGGVANHYYPDNIEEEDDDIEFKRYIPSSERRTLAEELRAARESERNRAAAALVEKTKSEKVKIPPKNEEQSKSKSKTVRGISKGVNAVRNVGRKASRTMHNYLDQEEEGYEYIDEDGSVISDWELDGIDDQWQQSGPLAATRRLRRRKVTQTKSIFSKLIGLVPYLFKKSYSAARWVMRKILYSPMMYTFAAIKWSANASLKTSSWASQTVFVGPLRTIAAPFIYSIEGLLFIFVWVPARILRALIRELYPVYVFLGAALAVGTAMGIAAAIVLYFGSFLFDDRSKFESSIHEQGEDLPKNMERYINGSFTSPEEKRSHGKQKATQKTKRSGSIIEDAIRESLQREQRARANGFASGGRDGRYVNGIDDDLAVNGNDMFGFEKAWRRQSSGEQAEESDEEDDYFGSHIAPKMFKNKSNASTASSQQSSSSFGLPATNTPNGPYSRSIPVGATGQGGWGTRNDSSNSSTPMASPVYARQNPTSPYSFTSSRQQQPIVNSSPASRVGPDSIRSHHSRQRRNVQAA